MKLLASAAKFSKKRVSKNTTLLVLREFVVQLFKD